VEPFYLRAEDIGVRLEVANGLPIWEAQPMLEHQIEVDRIRASIRPSTDHSGPCGCFHFADVYVAFGSDTVKRPDISLFCRMPEERREAIRLLPEAVIEVVSPHYEKKDLEVGLALYHQKGVPDVVVYDPQTKLVVHHGPHGLRRLESPVNIELQCGCVVTV